MKLSRYSDYALRILIQLASQPDRLTSIRQIATTYGISHNHLMKIAQDLGRAGILQTVRGRRGGLRLGRRPEDISVGSVVRLTELDAPMVDCSSCLIAPACSLPAMFGEAQSAFLQVLDRYSLADVMRQSRDLRGLFAGAAPKANRPLAPCPRPEQ